MALRLKSISKINAKSSINENITIDAKHNDMVKHFKDLQKAIPVLKNDLKNLINKYKTLDTKDKSEFEVIMEKNDLRDKINELKEKINCIVEKEEENKYFLYKIMEVSRNNDLSGLNFENTQIQKMVFIFNAVNDGWTVKKLDVDTYEFNMDTEKIKKEIVLDDYLKKFIKNNLDVEKLKR